MRIEIGALDFMVVACYIIIFGFFWRFVSARLAANDSPVGKAMAWIY
jgi:hypothetical protein